MCNRVNLTMTLMVSPLSMTITWAVPPSMDSPTSKALALGNDGCSPVMTSLFKLFCSEVCKEKSPIHQSERIQCHAVGLGSNDGRQLQDITNARTCEKIDFFGGLP